MTPATQQEVRKAICEDDLKTLAHIAGPCVTIQIPAYRPGDGSGSRHTLLRDLAQEAVSRVRNLNRTKGSVEQLASK